MIKILVIILTAYLYVGCSKPQGLKPGIIGNLTQENQDSLVETNPNPTSDTMGIKTYLALGDSYTIGESVQDNQKFPFQVSTQLTGLGFKTNPPEVIARTGWTTANLLERLKTDPPSSPNYTFVTLLIGVNNQYQGRPMDEYRQEFTTLLNKAIEYAGNNSNHVFVMSIPDWSVMPFANGRNKELIAKQIDSFNVINKQICLSKNARYTDITDLSRQAVANPALIASDGLHPSGEQYRMWVNRLVTTIRAAFY